MLTDFNYLFIFGNKSELYKKYTQKYHSLLIPTNLFYPLHSFLPLSSPPLQVTSLVSGLPSFVSFVPVGRSVWISCLSFLTWRWAHSKYSLALCFFHSLVYLRTHSLDANCALVILFLIYSYKCSFYKPDKSFSRHRQDIMFWGIWSLSWRNRRVLAI